MAGAVAVIGLEIALAGLAPTPPHREQPVETDADQDGEQEREPELAPEVEEQEFGLHLPVVLQHEDDRHDGYDQETDDRWTRTARPALGGHLLAPFGIVDVTIGAVVVAHRQTSSDRCHHALSGRGSRGNPSKRSPMMFR